MKRSIFFVFLMLSFFKTYACDCDTPKPILEFQSSEYVFDGKVISKIYSSDSLTYTVKFEILKHYKKNSNPKFLEFSFQSEGKYTGTWTSCDWSVDKNERWLVYAYYWKDKLTFSSYCSNSKILTENIPKSEQKILDNADNFEIDKYTFTNLEGSFTKSKPIINLDSILKKYSNIDYGKKYSDNRVDIVVDIDKNGNLLAVNLTSNEHMKTENNEIIDSIYNLNKPQNIEIRKPKTKFEKDIITIVKGLKTWRKTYIQGTETPIRIRKFLQFHKKSNEIKVYY
ncbi:MAG: hypothetical protein JKY02_04130 [Flavobacteriaceae bacterium]|nr:hypothetical protein [Flavobacteriaceae bacterium]